MPILEESLAVAREVGLQVLLGLSLLDLGVARLGVEDLEGAGVMLRESLGYLAQVGFREVRFEGRFAEGAALSIPEALELSLRP